MNNNIKNMFRTGVMIAAGALALASCSDTWNEHYDDSLGASGIKYQGSTLAYIQSNPQLSDFAEVLKATGVDARLSADQKLTVWAPVNGSFNKAEILRQAAENKDKVIKNFVQNHISLYALPIADKYQKARMLNEKAYDVPVYADSVNGSKVIEKNVSCTNGITHVVESPLVYRNNIYEQIVEEYEAWVNAGHAPESCPNNLYSFLQSKDSFILDESRSIANGVDEYGNRIYIDAQYDRYNEALDASKSAGLINADALVYEEDSSFIAIIPSPEAYQARFDYAKSLLKFNPKDTRSNNVDSLANEYANRFASYDLFFNNTNNAFSADSLKSTIYGRSNDAWYNHVYYRVQPRTHALPEGKQINDIIGEGKYTKRIECSNGVAYVVDNYPMSIQEQFCYPLRNLYATYRNTDFETGAPSVTAPSRNVPVDPNLKVILADSLQQQISETGDTTYVKVQYLKTVSGDAGVTNPTILTYVESGVVNPTCAFYLNETMSGKYTIKVVTAPIWARNGYEGRGPLDPVSSSQNGFKSSKAEYHFQARIIEKGADGNFPTATTAAVQLKASAVPGAYRDGDSFLSHTFRVDENGDSVVCMLDTITLGEYDFKYSYYGLGMGNGGVLLQISCEPSYEDVQNGKYAKDIIINKFILEPVIEDEKKNKGGK